MTISYIQYPLIRGFVHNWLVGGPQIVSRQRDWGHLFNTADWRSVLARQSYEADSGITETPVERGPISTGTFKIGTYEGVWTYTRCDHDHLVDLSQCHPSPCYVRGWAYTQLTSESDQPVMLMLTTYGPVDIWLEKQHVQRDEGFGRRQIQIEVQLHKGSQELLVRFEQVMMPGALHGFALRVVQADRPQAPATGVSVRIPTAIPDVEYRNRMEEILTAAYLDRDVYHWDEIIKVHWRNTFRDSEEVTVRLQTPSGRIYAESWPQIEAGSSTPLVHAHNVPQGPLQILLMPRIELYYEKDLRIRRILKLWGLGLQRYTDTAETPFQQRRIEALQNARRHHSATIYGEMAKMALDQWDDLEVTALEGACTKLDADQYDAPLTLLGLLGILYRFGEHERFPSTLGTTLAETACSFDYAALDLEDESRALLAAACELLAGQRYPDQPFTRSGEKGSWHRAHGEAAVMAWLHARARQGFGVWDSATAFEAELAALAHLIDLAEDDDIWEMASVVMDKLLFTIALNVHRGIYGSAQGVADAMGIKGGLLSPLAGVARLLWGQGIYNHHLAGTVSLALLENYAYTPLVQEVATSPPEENWGWEQHAISDTEQVRKVTYRTPDFMLSAAQDYQPGQPGRAEHIWQATLGPEAVVFVNHPAHAQDSEAHSPGFWRGNAVLPRVAQWKDVLIALYRLPEDDWMGYTHAYFPLYAFDEHQLRTNEAGQTWAFARQGEGYLALTATPTFTLMGDDPGAKRELRAYGTSAVWICQMGRAALDGEFAAFQEKVLALPLTVAGLDVSFETLRGDALKFGWDQPLQRNGEFVSLTNPLHYQNSYTATPLDAEVMEIRSSRYLLRLDFGQAHE